MGKKSTTMSYHKKFRIINAKTKSLYEEFNTPEAASKFLTRIRESGEDAILSTSDDDIPDDITEYTIEGMELETPNIDGVETEFGNDLDAFNEEIPLADNELPPVDEEDL